MSPAVHPSIADSGKRRGHDDASNSKPASTPVNAQKTYKGFVAGVFSGIAKLSGQ